MRFRFHYCLTTVLLLPAWMTLSCLYTNESSTSSIVQSLLFDWESGLGVIPQAVAGGDDTLALIAEHTRSFDTLSLCQAPRVAEVLAQIDTSACQKMMRAVLAREAQQPAEGGASTRTREGCACYGWWEESTVLPMVTAAYVLARQGNVEGLAEVRNALLQCAVRQESTRGVVYSSISRGMAAMSLGLAREESVGPALLRAVEGIPADDAPVALVEAAALIGSDKAIVPLRAALERVLDGPASMRQDVAVRIVRSLVILGDTECLHIIMLDGAKALSASEWQRHLLSGITGRDFGADYGGWLGWWRTQEGRYAPEPRIVACLKLEATRENRDWLHDLFAGAGGAPRNRSLLEGTP